jgi:hypothetical protein
MTTGMVRCCIAQGDIISAGFKVYRITLAVSQSSLNRSRSVKFAILLLTFTYCRRQVALAALLPQLLLCHPHNTQLPSVR